MEKFKKELKNTKNPWIKRIGNYLLSREDIKENLKKENKSLKECFDYILIEISKTAKREGQEGYASGDDEEIYALAVHYYDEDNIKVEKKNFVTNADGSADPRKLSVAKNPIKDKPGTKEIDQKVIDQEVAKALERYKQEEKQKEKQKKEEAKKKREELKAKKEAEKLAKQNKDDQLNLFDLLGDENV